MLACLSVFFFRFSAFNDISLVAFKCLYFHVFQVLNSQSVFRFVFPIFQVWSTKSPESGAALSDELPTFSLSPLGYITHVSIDVDALTIILYVQLAL